MISIIIPNYNQGQFAQECFNSILEQQLRPYEVIIVDDKSTDLSIESIKQNIKRILIKDVSIKWRLIQHPVNKGLPAARNTGINTAIGSYIVCLDMDDLLPSNYLSSCQQIMNVENVDIVYCNSLIFGEKEEEIVFPEFEASILQRLNFINCAAMINRKVWKKNKYDENFTEGLEDYEFWISAYLSGFKFKKNTQSYLLYRQKTTGMVQEMTTKKMKRNKSRFQNKHPDFIIWNYEK